MAWIDLGDGEYEGEGYLTDDKGILIGAGQCKKDGKDNTNIIIHSKEAKP